MSRLVLTVFFEDPFWVGVVEAQEGDTLRAARHVFGPEPSAGEVLAFVLHRMGPLLDQANVTLTVAPRAPRPARPKQAARLAAREISARGISTQSQTALRLQLEQHKRMRHHHGKAEREAEAAYKRQRKVAKAKARHRGR